jgi:hypothetical protein
VAGFRHYDRHGLDRDRDLIVIDQKEDHHLALTRNVGLTWFSDEILRMILNDFVSIMLENKDSEDNRVALFLAHEESMLSWNGSYLVTEGYKSY